MAGCRATTVWNFMSTVVLVDAVKMKIVRKRDADNRLRQSKRSASSVRTAADHNGEDHILHERRS